MSQDTSWAVDPTNEQNTQAWHLWRAQGIGGSDAPIVMAQSPWSTPFKLWQEKTGQKANNFEGNFATERGHRLEPIARAKYNFLNKCNCEPALLTLAAHPFLRCSLDGWSQEQNFAIEIKAPGKDDHETAKKGLVPHKYQWQLVHQLLVTGAKWVDYVSYFVDKDQADDQGDMVVVRVLPDAALAQQYFERAFQFWECVQNKVAPPLTSDDRLEVNDERFKTLVGLYKERKADLDIAKARLDLVKEELTNYAKEKGHPKLECDGLRITRIEQKGRVNYSKVPISPDVDLEEYRGKGTSFYKIEEVKK